MKTSGEKQKVTFDFDIPLIDVAGRPPHLGARVHLRVAPKVYWDENDDGFGIPVSRSSCKLIGGHEQGNDVFLG